MRSTMPDTPAPCQPARMRPESPWRLTPSQIRVMDAMVATGRYKGAARALGISDKTVHGQFWKAKKAMGASCMSHALINWYLWRNGAPHDWMIGQ